MYTSGESRVTEPWMSLIVSSFWSAMLGVCTSQKAQRNQRYVLTGLQRVAVMILLAGRSCSDGHVTGSTQSGFWADAGAQSGKKGRKERFVKVVAQQQRPVRGVLSRLPAPFRCMTVKSEDPAAAAEVTWRLATVRRSRACDLCAIRVDCACTFGLYEHAVLRSPSECQSNYANTLASLQCSSDTPIHVTQPSGRKPVCSWFMGVMKPGMKELHISLAFEPLSYVVTFAGSVVWRLLHCICVATPIVSL